MTKIKKNIAERFATLVTENEWSFWQECPSWIPSRPVVKAKQLTGKKCKCFDKLDMRKPIGDDGRCFLALFELPVGMKYKKGEGVPFYRTVGLLALDETDETLLRVRYGGRNCSVGMIGASAKVGLVKAFRRSSLSEMREGGERLLEIFGIANGSEGVFHEDQVSMFKESPGSNSTAADVAGRVLGYVRYAPNFPEGLLGAVCDMGVILRGIDSVDKDVVSEFAVKVGEILKARQPFGVKEAQNLIYEYASLHPVVRLDVLLFLHWKYLAGQKDGQIDFGEIEKNLVEAREMNAEDCCCRAMITLGQLSGFANYAANYHSRMRERTLVEKTSQKNAEEK